MANDHSGDIRLSAGRLSSREHSDLPEIVASAAGERGIECRDFGFVEVVFHSSLARLFSHVTFARTSSIRNRTPWLSDGFSQSMRSKMRDLFEPAEAPQAQPE